ncbi:uncharacterized protein LOC135959262 [Calliphora vicina]|uniref:uncharacterized protein LOC135959262 n=1 Tax=Calliphora vicina TaxID=7373 RepID=UPI00325B33BF
MAEKHAIILLVFLQIALQIQQIAMVAVGPLDYNHYPNATYPLPATTIERVEHFSNGCYKQRVREPDLLNTTRFYETEQLICPPGVNVSFVPANNTPIQALPVLPYPAHNMTPSYIRPAGTAPIAAMPPPAAPNPVVITQQQLSPAGIPSNTTSQVVVLSKKSGFYDHEKKKNSANSLYKFNCIFVFVFTAIFYNFN